MRTGGGWGNIELVWTDAYVIINIDKHDNVNIIITVFIHGDNNSNQRHTLYSPRSIVASGFCNNDIAILNEAPLIADSTLIGVSYHFPSTATAQPSVVARYNPPQQALFASSVQLLYNSIQCRLRNSHEGACT